MASVLPAVNKNFYLSAKTLQSENRHARAIKGCEIGINVFTPVFEKIAISDEKIAAINEKTSHKIIFSLFFGAASRALKKIRYL